ncbi:DUF397 domain-containing protein [Streptomyces sp. NBC_01808]|uniref:DUF397 domain-containing protein n=1 Tax=Streptomyces sp. NBC_01808 TaxID=2975947 RepID=UPI002DD9959A|nr:DUF397 domain-containing protein [Streptomyces sp. NBC_01808]WSA40036.1 DUF397 domain-containing protein [Streptomyces sp. NBC_01808]
MAITWRKSSYSESNGGNCIEVAAEWRTSSYSESNGGDCVEVKTTPTAIPVRDSKDPEGPQLAFTPAAWTAFLASVKAGELSA